MFSRDECSFLAAEEEVKMADVFLSILHDAAFDLIGVTFLLDLEPL